ncbi:class I SAM-dependent rRNA methyltransferase [Dokdonia sinensis]|uniref:Class I SAM-dependent rRNA methyltransferase n=1 Tax=Dokdonia sinensis TaxID=2479847 RepID=A0A3M0G9I0_9FLAO|nr:class I SAM-dependent rRNA methyltransferase [Dokdonia sinensis]RMB60877.1 class I SAM-dependent rRNA methyltransferase [Dokdonia sinensis]
MQLLPEILTKTLAIKLTATAEKLVKQGHPWIFTDSIVKCNKEGVTGDIAVLFDNRRDKPFAIGLYDAQSPIRIKVINYAPAKLETVFFKEKIEKAFKLRAELLRTDTNSYRLIFGENDGFPGLIADVYDDFLVVKLYSAIWYPYFNEILLLLKEISKVKTVVLRLSRNLQQQKNYGLSDGQVVFGVLKNEVVFFKEYGINFSANVIHGHKTGYFLDHRLNRKRVGAMAKGKTVLDVFSYAGGFSVHALAGGAKMVMSLDISKQALEVALENGKLNPSKGTHNIYAIDAFEGMQQLISDSKAFDIVVIDPPSFAKRASEVHTAKNSYARLAALGGKLTKKGGTLILASCSSRVSAQQFFDISESTLRDAGHSFEILDKTYHDSDHPIAFPEGAYLKCGYYKVY